MYTKIALTEVNTKDNEHSSPIMSGTFSDYLTDHELIEEESDP
jgi:hypothetical protein